MLQYTFLLLLIFLLEVMAGLLAYVYQAQVDDELSLTLNATFLETYRIKNEQTAAIDRMQQEVCLDYFTNIGDMIVDYLNGLSFLHQHLTAMNFIHKNEHIY